MFENKESRMNKSRRNEVLSTNRRAYGSHTMNKENALDDVSFLCGGFVFVLVGCCVGRGFVVLCWLGLRCCVAIMRAPVSRARVANKVE